MKPNRLVLGFFAACCVCSAITQAQITISKIEAQKSEDFQDGVFDCSFFDVTVIGSGIDTISVVSPGTAGEFDLYNSGGVWDGGSSACDSEPNRELRFPDGLYEYRFNDTELVFSLNYSREHTAGLTAPLGLASGSVDVSVVEPLRVEWDCSPVCEGESLHVNIFEELADIDVFSHPSTPGPGLPLDATSLTIDSPHSVGFRAGRNYGLEVDVIAMTEQTVSIGVPAFPYEQWSSRCNFTLFNTAKRCGDLNADGEITEIDTERFRDLIAGVSPSASVEEAMFCNVKLDSPEPGVDFPGSPFPSNCSILDSVIQRRDRAGLSPGTEEVCPGASQEPCCTAHPSVACDDATVASCVCSSRPSCCTTEWDVSCVLAVNTLGCGSCD